MRSPEIDSTRFRLLDRVLAVTYVLSYAAQWLGFLILGGVGAYLVGTQGLDAYSGGLVLSGFAWVGMCASFRPCVRWWGMHRMRKQAAGRRESE